MSMVDADMFNPALYESIRRPATEAETLPPWCYTSEEFYRAEVKNLFMKVWNFLGRAERLPNPGDYFTVTYAGIPLLIVRGRDQKLRAFSNVCRHRGARLADGEGNCRGISCPYHGWTYDLDGKLLNAVGMESSVGFEPAKFGLVEVRLETWGGFIFVNFDDKAEDLLTYLGDMPQTLAAYDCENLVLTRRKIHEVECNWKIHIENAMEDYHVPYVHGTTLNALKVEHWNEPARGNWFNMRERHDPSLTRALLQEDRGHALPLMSTLTGHAAEGTNFVCINPSTMLGMTLDCVWYIELQPQGPNRTRVEVGSCFPKSTVARSDFEEKVKYYYKRWDKSIGEDNVIAAIQQQGLSSPLVKRGRLSHLEPLIPQLGAWWIDRVLGNAATTH